MFRFKDFSDILGFVFVPDPSRNPDRNPDGLSVPRPLSCKQALPHSPGRVLEARTVSWSIESFAYVQPSLRNPVIVGAAAAQVARAPGARGVRVAPHRGGRPECSKKTFRYPGQLKD